MFFRHESVWTEEGRRERTRDAKAFTRPASQGCSGCAAFASLDPEKDPIF
jgi:hypothetical protein